MSVFKTLCICQKHSGMRWGKTCIREHFQSLPGDFSFTCTILCKCITEHMPGSWCGEWFFCFRRFREKVIRSLDNVINYPGMKIVLLGPLNPLSGIRFHLYMEHSVNERRRHGLYDGRVLCSVSCTYNNTSFRQMVFTDPSFVDERVEGFLYFLGAGIEFIKEENIRLFSCNHLRWKKLRGISFNLRNTNDIFRSKLASKK